MGRELIDDLLAKVPHGWDFWIGSSWDEAGAEIYTARLQLRAPEHFGHYALEIEKSGETLRGAIESALVELPQSPP